MWGGPGTGGVEVDAASVPDVHGIPGPSGVGPITGPRSGAIEHLVSRDEAQASSSTEVWSLLSAHFALFPFLPTLTLVGCREQRRRSPCSLPRCHGRHGWSGLEDEFGMPSASFNVSKPASVHATNHRRPCSAAPLRSRCHAEGCRSCCAAAGNLPWTIAAPVSPPLRCVDQIVRMTTQRRSHPARRLEPIFCSRRLTTLHDVCSIEQYRFFGAPSLMEKRTLPSPLRPTHPAEGVASLPNYRHPFRHPPFHLNYVVSVFLVILISPCFLPGFGIPLILFRSRLP